ncbi:MAG: hypothetical protein DI558_02855 [Corynebacterium propinquum]|nr:MAG: hypothetical protein DI558_02855 [Corynebacterium propinquum]
MNHAGSICVYTLTPNSWGFYAVQGPWHLRDQLAFNTHSFLFGSIQFSEAVGKLGKTALKEAHDAYKAAFLDPLYQAAIQRCVIHAKISEIASQIIPFLHHHLYLQPEIFDDDSLLDWIKQYAHTIDPALNLGRPIHFNPDFEIETPQGQKPELIGFYGYMYDFPWPNLSRYCRNEQELLTHTQQELPLKSLPPIYISGIPHQWIVNFLFDTTPNCVGGKAIGMAASMK